jgi:hypothetical protein
MSNIDSTEAGSGCSAASCSHPYFEVIPMTKRVSESGEREILNPETGEWIAFSKLDGLSFSVSDRQGRQIPMARFLESVESCQQAFDSKSLDSSIHSDQNNPVLMETE